MAMGVTNTQNAMPRPGTAHLLGSVHQLSSRAMPRRGRSLPWHCPPITARTPGGAQVRPLKDYTTDDLRATTCCTLGVHCQGSPRGQPPPNEHVCHGLVPLRIPRTDNSLTRERVLHLKQQQQPVGLCRAWSGLPPPGRSKVPTKPMV